MLSQTFVLTEYEQVRQHVPAMLAALFSSREAPAPGLADDLLDSVVFVPLASLRTFRSNARWFARRPGRYLSTLGRALRGSFRRPAGGMTRGVVVFVKAVALADEIIAFGATRVHAHFIHHPATAAWIIGRLTGIPYSVTAHADDLFCGPALLEEKVRDAAAIVTISEYNRRYIRVRTAGACDPRVIHCGIALERFPYRERKGCRRFVCVARLEPKKGHADLIHAFAIASAEAPTLTLDLVGEGAERARIAQLARSLGVAGRVRLHGALAPDAVRELLDECDAFVLAALETGSTSFHRGYMDGIPVALIEAMAVGLPVISTRISGIPELVIEGTGILVSPGDVESFAQAMLDLHHECAGASALARCARRQVEQHFDAGREAGKLVDLFAGERATDSQAPVGLRASA